MIGELEKNRINDLDISQVVASLKDCFQDWLGNEKIGLNATALSVSTGEGIWDCLAFSANSNIRKILATDIVDCAVSDGNVSCLKEMGEWTFVKVNAEEIMPFEKESFELVYHHDVIEHVKKPMMFLSDHYRMLKKGGILIFATPNLLRPANLLKLIIGTLKFPLRIGFHPKFGELVHVQEYSQRQLEHMLKKVGFENIEFKHCFLGIFPLNIMFKKYPKSFWGRKICHSLMVKCVK